MEKRKREFMERLDSCYSVVQQSSPKGISAREIAEKLRIHRTTAHSYLNTLELMGKVYSQKGLWYPTNSQQKTILDLPSELRREIDRIKECYIKDNIEEASRRLYLLVTTQVDNLDLPQTLKNELNAVKKEYNARMKKINFWKKLLFFEDEYLEIRRVMIPKFLKVLEKIYLSLREGVMSE